jgi:hypothetical protein
MVAGVEEEMKSSKGIKPAAPSYYLEQLFDVDLRARLKRADQRHIFNYAPTMCRQERYVLCRSRSETLSA